MAFITIENLKKKFGSHEILKGISLAIPQNSMTVICGRSGQGKSVLLKLIIGLLQPDEGTILLHGKPTTAESLKKFGYVFQFAALLDSLTIFENMALPLVEQKLKNNIIKQLITEKLELVHLTLDILDKYPCELSGGMRKRVGLARTLLSNPSIILYDEPTTGLDPITTRAIHELMAHMQQKLGVTSIVVSHDPNIFEYADYGALLHDGLIHWHGKAKDIWVCQNPFMHQFIRGLTNGPILTEPKTLLF